MIHQGDRRTCGCLPDCNQTWAHSIVSQAQLKQILQDQEQEQGCGSSITALETDVVLGTLRCESSSLKTSSTSSLLSTLNSINNNNNNNKNNTKKDGALQQQQLLLPITAHPPDTCSDLSLQMLLECLNDNNDEAKQQLQQVHIKLDIKQNEAVVPTLRLVQDVFGAATAAPPNNKNKNKNNSNPVVVRRRTLFLNADILPGPGRGEHDVKVSALEFVSHCQEMLLATTTTTTTTISNNLNVAFSLGWNVDVCWPFGYTAKHVQRMNQVLEDASRRIPLLGAADTKQSNNSTVPAPSTLLIVWAVNARLLANSDPQPFLDFLSQGTSKNRQLLVWSGVGEPPIGMHTLQTLVQMYRNVPGQVGYDVQISDNDRKARMADTVMYLLGWKNLILRLVVCQTITTILVSLPTLLWTILFWIPVVEKDHTAPP